MAIKPILFNTPMSLAARIGIKTETRRLITPRYRDDETDYWQEKLDDALADAYGEELHDSFHQRYPVAFEFDYKCNVYGDSNSEASDWAKRWLACGLFNKPWDGKPIMRLVIPNRKDKEEIANTPLEGQLSMEV